MCEIYKNTPDTFPRMLKQVETTLSDKFKYHLQDKEGKCIKRSKTIVQLDMYLHGIWKGQKKITKFDKFKELYHVEVHPLV